MYVSTVGSRNDMDALKAVKHSPSKLKQTKLHALHHSSQNLSSQPKSVIAMFAHDTSHKICCSGPALL